MKTLYIHIALKTIEEEQVKQATCRIDDAVLPKVYSYPDITEDLVIKESVAAKLTTDGYTFDAVELE